MYTTDPSLPLHTIYLPSTVPSGVKLPVLVWGNGVCGANGLAFEQFLTQIASHGYLVVANGSPGGSGGSQASWLTQSFDWVHSTTTKAKYLFVEAGRIVVAGQSCGGTEAYAVAQDERVAAVGVFNSGYLNEARGKVPLLEKPVFYFLGGLGDIAYQNVSSITKMSSITKSLNVKQADLGR
jgi:dienelactone hydrolase